MLIYSPLSGRSCKFCCKIQFAWQFLCFYLVGSNALLESLTDLSFVAVSCCTIYVAITHTQGIFHCFFHLQSETDYTMKSVETTEKIATCLTRNTAKVQTQIIQTQIRSGYPRRVENSPLLHGLKEQRAKCQQIL